MFREMDMEAYVRIKAPVELKNRVKQSVERQRKIIAKQSVVGLSAAACLAIVLLSGGLFGSNGTMVYVNDAAVSYEAMDLNASAEYSPVMASRMRSSVPQIQVPLEIQVKKDAHISVSQGALKKLVETDSESEFIMEMDISESTVVYWTVNGDIANPPTCTVTAGGKEYVYVIEFEEEAAVFTIRQIQ